MVNFRMNRRSSNGAGSSLINSIKNTPRLQAESTGESVTFFGR